MMNRSIQFIVCVLAILCQNINSAVAQTRSYDGVILFRNWLLLHILTIFRKYPSRDIMNTWRMNAGFH